MKLVSIKFNFHKMFFILAFCLISLSLPLIAQDNSSVVNNKPDTLRAYIGPYLGYNLNMHFPNFMRLNDTCSSCNPVPYDASLGSGIAFGGLFEYLLYSDGKRTPMSIGLRLGYSDVSASLSSEENIGNAINEATGEITDAISEHIIDANITQINIAPYFAYYFTERLVGNVGLNVGYMLAHSSDRREELVSPEWKTYLDGSKVRNKFDDIEIPNINPLQFGVLVGFGYEFPIGKYSKLMPEVQYNFTFNDVSDVDWNTSSLRLGAALKFGLVKDAYVVPEIFYQRDTIIDYKRGIDIPEIVLKDTRKELRGNDTLIIEEYTKYLPRTTSVNVDLSYSGIINDIKVNNPEVIIEEFETIEYFPFLPIVYFKDGKSDLGNTKQVQLSSAQTANFDDEKLINQDIFDLYYNMLNILAKRMQRFPNTKITVTGYSTGVGEDANNKNIAIERANSVKNYIVNTWEISANRITVNTSAPIKRNPDDPSYADVVEENQKVQIYTSGLDLIMPIVIPELEKVAIPSEITFDLTADADDGINNYDLSLTLQGNRLRNYNDNNLDGSNKLNTTKNWIVLDEPIPLTEGVADIVFNVVDNSSQSNSVTKNISIKQRTVKNKKSIDSMNVKIERYSLCLFDFDKATLTPVHRRILDIIKGSIQLNSKLFINGYADRIGERQYNIDIAQRRLDVVNNTINSGNKLNATLESIGNTNLIYDNNSPEGRAFSRTVKIEIHTPSIN